MPRVLLIAPYFPPMRVVGARRPLMLVRHLPAFGFDPVVLTADPAREPVDDTLGLLIPPAVPISTGYGAPANGSAPGATAPEGEQFPRGPYDRYFWDLRRAITAGLRLAAAYRPHVVHVCAGPFSALFAGRTIARRAYLPWVADLRDPWALHAGKMPLRPAVSQWLVRRSELGLLRSAARIVLNSEASFAAHREAYRGKVPEARFRCIRNAFDPGLFRTAPAPGAEAPFTLLHFGQFRRLVGAGPLLAGLARFVTRVRPEPGRFRFRTVGVLRDADRAIIAELGLGPYVDVAPEVPYTEAMRELRAADLLAFTLDDRMALTIPAKLYDYLAARRPILAVTDQPEPAAIVRDTESGVVVPPDDPDEMATELEHYWRVRQAGPIPDLPEDRVAAFRAEAQAGRMADVYREAIAEWRAR